jgi:serine/threonine protein kinase
MGSVYEAEQIDTGRRVAVKVLAGADAAQNPSLVARFALEARAAGQLETPHVVRVLDAGVDAEHALPFMAMELLHGDDAQALIAQRGALAPDVAVRIVAQACLGLAEAHEAGVVHRDIKSANLFLARGDGDAITVKIVDFGLAKASFGAGSMPGGGGLTRTGTILGSPLFMAPEQARGARDADARSDIWSMGVVLFHLLTGRVPHDEIDGLGELLITICSEPPPRIRDVAPWVSEEVDAIVDRALRLDPRERFQRAEDMLDALFRLLPAGSAVSQVMLLAKAEPPPAAAIVANAAPIALENKPEIASPLPVVDVAKGAAPRLAPPPQASFADSDQAVVSPLLPPPARRRRNAPAPLLLFAAALVGALLGMGFFRLELGPRPAGASAAPGSIAAPVTLHPVVAPAPAPAAVDAGVDASPAERRGNE